MSLNEQLLEAVLNNNLEKTKELLKFGANVNAQNGDFVTPLQIAAYNGDIKMVRILIDHGADVDKADQLGFSPFFHAVYKGHIGVMLLLLESGSKPKHTYLGATPMTLACGVGNLAVVKLLLTLSYPAEPLRRFSWCPSPIMIAAFQNHGETLLYLLEQKPPLAQIDYQLPGFCYFNALAVTMLCNRVKMGGLLIELGSNPDLCIGTGESIRELSIKYRRELQHLAPLSEESSPFKRGRKRPSDENQNEISSSSSLNKCPKTNSCSGSNRVGISCAGIANKGLTLGEIMVQLEAEKQSKKRPKLLHRIFQKI